jgi:nitronate monooxygenase
MNVERFLATTRKAWASSMAPGEYAAFLSELLNAEHDRMRLLSAYLQELDAGSLEWDAIQLQQLNDIRNCTVLAALMREEGEKPTPAVGAFYGRGLALRDRRRRLGFLRHIQEWLAARLAAGLPRVPPRARHVLQEMVDAHLATLSGR